VPAAEEAQDVLGAALHARSTPRVDAGLAPRRANAAASTLSGIALDRDLGGGRQAQADGEPP
jgi:hypothetical protein